MINQSWPLRPLGELFEIGSGKTMSAAGRAGAEKTPFLRTSNVLWDEIDLTTVDEMAIPAHELPGKLVQPGDLLVCEGGEIGRAAIWTGGAPIMSFQNHLHRLRPLGSDVDSRFYVYFLQSAFTQLGIFEGAANKTTIPNLSRSRLAAFDVPHPPLDEQQAVVGALARVRDATRIHDRSTRLAQELKRGAMRELFRRGLRGETQRETEIGLVPESWSVEPISHFTKRSQYGLSIRGGETGQYPILRMNCQEDGRVVLRDLQYVELDQATADAFRLNRGDILFNRTNSYELVGRTAIVDDDLDAVFASYLVRLTIDDERLLPRYLNYFLNWDFAQSELKKLASRAVGQANINATKLGGLNVPVPPIYEQGEIVAILEAIDRKIDVHRRKQAALDELFKALLYKLMTGEISVGDLDLSALAPMQVAEAAQ